MATIQFYIRSKKKAGALSNIRIRLREGRNIDLHGDTRIKAHVEFWDNKLQHVKNSKKIDYVHEVNNKLHDLRNFILSEVAMYSGTFDKNWLSNTIDKYYTGGKVNDLIGYIGEYVERYPVKSKKGGYDRLGTILEDFSGGTLPFEKIDLDWFYSFVEYLEQENYSQNYTAKNVRLLKLFLNSATEDGYKTTQAHKSKRFTAKLEDVDNIYLSEGEIQRMYNLNLSGMKAQARDLFIIGCWTGQRHSDWNKITSENIEGDFINLTQQKTNNSVVVPVHEMVRDILKKHSEGFKSISLPTLNSLLKEIAKEAGINGKHQKTITRGGITRTVTLEKWEMVSTHTARRSFATNLYKAGMPSYTIMQVTGHKTESSFLKYIKVTPNEHAQKLLEFWQNRPIMQVAN